MNVNLSRAQQLGLQRYNPRRVGVRRRQLDEFQFKEFESGDIAELFHENTKVTERTFRWDGRTVTAFNADESLVRVQKNMQPDYAGKERIDLPEPADDLGARLSRTLVDRQTRRDLTGGGISLQRLSTLLHYSWGVTHYRGDEESTAEQKPLRSYPSAGGLYPVEPYVAVFDGGPDLNRGLYYYVPEIHALRRLDAPNEIDDAVYECLISPDLYDVENAALAVLLTGSFWRSKAKYGPRGYRFVLQESGHCLQNFQLVAEAMNVGVVPIGGVYEDRANDLLDVNGVDEGVVYVALAGTVDGGDA